MGVRVLACAVVVAGAACSQAPEPEPPRTVQLPDPPACGDPRAGHWDDRFSLPGVERAGFEGVDAWVKAITMLPDGSVAIGGSFDRAAGVPAKNVAAFDGTAWRALGEINRTVWGLAVDDAGVLWALTGYLGGGLPFVEYWDGTTWTVVDGIDASGMVGITAIDGGIAVYGRAAQVSGVATYGVAVWDGTSWAGLGLGSGNDVAGLVRTATGFCAAGLIGVAAQGLADRNGLACWDGSTWTEVGEPIPGWGGALAQGSDGRWWIGGGQWQLGSTVIYGVGFLDSDGTWQPLDGGLVGTGSDPRGFANSIAFDSSGGVDVAGSFVGAGPDRVPAANLARWTPELGWQPLAAPGISGGDLTSSVFAMVADGDRMHVGGSFAAVGQMAAADVATIEPDGTVTQLIGDGGALGARGEAVDLIASGDSVVVAGRVTADSIVAAPMATFDQIWHRMPDPPTSNVVAEAVRSDGSLVVSGDGIYDWNGSVWTTLVPDLPRPSPILVDADDAIYYASATQIRRLDRSGADALLGIVYGTVVALTAFDGHLVVATNGGSQRPQLLALIDGTWLPIEVGPTAQVVDASWSPALGLVVLTTDGITAWDGRSWREVIEDPRTSAMTTCATGVYFATWTFDQQRTGTMWFSNGVRVPLGALPQIEPLALVPTADGIYLGGAEMGRSMFGLFRYD